MELGGKGEDEGITGDTGETELEDSECSGIADEAFDVLGDTERTRTLDGGGGTGGQGGTASTKKKC